MKTYGMTTQVGTMISQALGNGNWQKQARVLYRAKSKAEVFRRHPDDARLLKDITETGNADEIFVTKLHDPEGLALPVYTGVHGGPAIFLDRHARLLAIRVHCSCSHGRHNHFFNYMHGGKA